MKLLLALVTLLGTAWLTGCERSTAPATPAATGPAAVTQPFGGSIRPSVRDSEPEFTAEPQAPANAPNIVIVLADDVGYADVAPFGSEIRTPTLQKIADTGLRYSHFTVTAMCSPTRAAMLTGLNQHAVGVGWVSEWDFGYPGYRGEMPAGTDTLPKILQRHGYSTLMVGKWHLTNANHRSSVGPFSSWPTQNGFDRYWGFLDGEASQWLPHALVAGNEFIDYPKDGSFYLPDAMTDRAIAMLRDLRAQHPQRPFLLYFSTGAAHAPHHSKPEDIARYHGLYARGWDAVRAERLERQKASGLLPAQTRLARYNEGVQPWQALTPEQQQAYARFQENYAGFVDNLDQNIGRLVQYLQDSGQWDNTLFIFLSDNGSSREVGVEGDANALRFFHRRPASTADNLPALDRLGDASTHPHYPHGWAQASNTPFAEGKRSTHEGGVRVPMIVSWPRGITQPGTRHQFHHITDIAPTVLDILGLDPASAGNRPMHGTSMRYSFNAPDAAPQRRQQYYEIEGSRGYVDGDWKIVAHRAEDQAFDAAPWQLYNLREDPAETTDLAAAHPDKVQALAALWQRDAEANQVLPLIDVPLLRRPLLSRLWRDGATPMQFHYEAGLPTIPRFKGPILPNRSYTITAKVHRDDTSQQGVLIALGDRYSGFTFFIQDNRLHFEQNVAHSVMRIASDEPLPAGELTLEFRFDKVNTALGAVKGLFGKGSVDPLDVLGGTGSLRVNGKPAGKAELPYPVFAVWEGFDIGADRITPVSPRYASPFAFSGTLHSVDVTLD